MIIGTGPLPPPTKAQTAALRMRWPTAYADLDKGLSSPKKLATNLRSERIEEVFRAVAILGPGALIYHHNGHTIHIETTEQSVRWGPPRGEDTDRSCGTLIRTYYTEVPTRGWVWKTPALAKASGFGVTPSELYILMTRDTEVVDAAIKVSFSYGTLRFNIVANHGRALNPLSKMLQQLESTLQATCERPTLLDAVKLLYLSKVPQFDIAPIFDTPGGLVPFVALAPPTVKGVDVPLLQRIQPPKENQWANPKRASTSRRKKHPTSPA